MAQVTVETVSYPGWWAGATTVNITVDTGSSTYTFSNVSRANVEMLPQGLAISTGFFTSWAQVINVEKVS